MFLHQILKFIIRNKYRPNTKCRKIKTMKGDGQLDRANKLE